MPTAHSTNASAQDLRQQWLRNLPRLAFPEPWENSFRDQLHASQHRASVFTLWLCALVWVFFIALDFYRLQLLPTPVAREHFFWLSLMPRWPVLLCFAALLWQLHRSQAQRTTYERLLACSFVAICTAIATASITLQNLDMLNTAVVLVLIITVAFFPLGVRFHFMLAVACLCCLIISLAGPLLLAQPQDTPAYTVLSAVAWLNLLLSAGAAYYREKGLREQFILQHLLDWEASHDPLTGLANRRRFREHCAVLIKQSQRDQCHIFLAILDIDHFKLYNDRLGHAAGDEVLRTFAQLLQRYAQRPLDLAVRLGGEEFALLLYDTSYSQLQTHLECLLQEMAAHPIAHPSSPTAAHVTVSIGAAMVDDTASIDQAFQQADRLLYQAKQLGRNQLQLHCQAASSIDSRQ